MTTTFDQSPLLRAINQTEQHLAAALASKEFNSTMDQGAAEKAAELFTKFIFITIACPLFALVSIPFYAVVYKMEENNSTDPAYKADQAFSSVFEQPEQFTENLPPKEQYSPYTSSQFDQPFTSHYFPFSSFESTEKDDSSFDQPFTAPEPANADFEKPFRESEPANDDFNWSWYNSDPQYGMPNSSAEGEDFPEAPNYDFHEAPKSAPFTEPKAEEAAPPQEPKWMGVDTDEFLKLSPSKDASDAFKAAIKNIQGAVKERNALAILGLPANASPTDIKKSYRNLALVLHPDKNLDDEILAKKAFIALQEAYSTLLPKS